jgi:hypothetical protein
MNKYEHFKVGDLVKLSPRAILILGFGQYREVLLGTFLIVKVLPAPKDELNPSSRCFQCISPICGDQHFMLYSDDLTLLE